MASLETTNRVYVRVFKRAVGNPAYVWSNTYEMEVAGSGTPLTAAEWQTALEGVVAAERPLHQANVEFVKATASTWVAEPRQPYDPSSFAIYEVAAGTLGTRTANGDPLPRRMVLHVKKAVDLGRSGKLFLRGCLGEGDISAGTPLDMTLVAASKASLDTALTTMYNAIRTAVTSYNIVLIHPNGNTRAVSDFEARGITTLSDNHGYYDRLD